MLHWHVFRRFVGSRWFVSFVLAVIVYSITIYSWTLKLENARTDFRSRLLKLQNNLNMLQVTLKDRNRECNRLRNLPGLSTAEQVNEQFITLPTFVDFLPHLFAVSESLLQPAFTSQNDTSPMMKTQFVIGIPTVARQNHSYLLTTLQSLIGSITSDEAKIITIVVLISDSEGPNSSFVQHHYASIHSEFPSEVNSGLLEVIVPPREWYPPDLHSLARTFNDPPERMFWRTKQNLDYMYLMLYCQRRGEYYLQLEDDVVAKAGTISRIKKFTEEHVTKEWLMLEFATLGFIGKLFRTSDLTLLTQFIALFHRQKPVDWLLDLLFINRYCNPEKSNEDCAEAAKQHRILHRPSLFQHIGVHSSLAGKVQKLKERDFGSLQLYVPHHDNPPAKITTTLQTYMLFDIENAYSGNNYYWALAPVAEDYILFEFDNTITLTGIVIRTGNPEHQFDILNDNAEVLLKKVYEGNFTSVARFNERGTVHADFGKGIKVDSMKIEIHEESSNWLIINEIHVIVQ